MPVHGPVFSSVLIFASFSLAVEKQFPFAMNQSMQVHGSFFSSNMRAVQACPGQIKNWSARESSFCAKDDVVCESQTTSERGVFRAHARAQAQHEICPRRA